MRSTRKARRIRQFAALDKRTDHYMRYEYSKLLHSLEAFRRSTDSITKAMAAFDRGFADMSNAFIKVLKGATDNEGKPIPFKVNFGLDLSQRDDMTVGGHVFRGH